MLRKFDGTSLMDIDMTGPHADNALVLIEHRVDGGGVGLCTARQEEYLGIGHADGFADAVLGTLRELVEAIRRRTGIIVTHQVLENFRMGPIVIIALKGDHNCEL